MRIRSTTFAIALALALPLGAAILPSKATAGVCVPTTTKVSAPNRINWGDRSGARVTVVRTVSGLPATGSLRLSYVHAGIVSTGASAKEYTGGRKRFAGPRFKDAGRWWVVAQFSSTGEFCGSSDSTKVRVRRR